VNKAQYIQLFKEQLKGLPERDLEELIYDYEEHFTIGLSEGRSEAEIADSLGNPKTLAKEMKANYRISRVEEKFTFNNFYRALFATIGLGFLNLLFILGPFIGIAVSLFAIFVSGIAIIGSGLFVIIASFLPMLFHNVPDPLLAIFVGLALGSLGGLWTIASWYLNKYFYLITIKYLKFNVKIISNRRMNND
jgi:uncharacterized membrane protein